MKGLQSLLVCSLLNYYANCKATSSCQVFNSKPLSWQASRYKSVRMMNKHEHYAQPLGNAEIIPSWSNYNVVIINTGTFNNLQVNIFVCLFVLFFSAQTSKPQQYGKRLVVELVTAFRDQCLGKVKDRKVEFGPHQLEAGHYIPCTDLVLNTVYRNLASTCHSTIVFHSLFVCDQWLTTND